MQIGRYNVWVGWGDVDAAAIVYYPKYFSWFDNSTNLLFEQVGLPLVKLEDGPENFAIPAVNVGIEFSAPWKFGDRFVVETHIAEWSTKSFKVAHKVMKGDKVALKGFEIRVWAHRHPDDPDRLVTKPIPQEVKDLFNR